MKFIPFQRNQFRIDILNIKRDPMLRYFIFLPYLLIAIVVIALPYTEATLRKEGISIQNFERLINSFFYLSLIPVLYGIIIGFMLLDEKDENTLQAIQITPNGLNSYILVKLLPSLVLSSFTLIIIFPVFINIKLNLLIIIALSGAASLWSGIFALSLPTFAANKVEGFTLMKAMNLLFIIPIFAFFISEPYQLIFGICPTFWLVKSYWLFDDGELLSGIGSLFISIFSSIVIIKWLKSRFLNVIN